MKIKIHSACMFLLLALLRFRCPRKKTWMSPQQNLL